MAAIPFFMTFIESLICGNGHQMGVDQVKIWIRTFDNLDREPKDEVTVFYPLEVK